MNHYPPSLLNGRRIAWRTLTGVSSGRVYSIQDSHVFARIPRNPLPAKVSLSDIVRVYN